MTERWSKVRTNSFRSSAATPTTLAVLIDTIALGPEKEDNLDESRFVCMRRANDLSQEGDFIPAPEAGKHDDPSSAPIRDTTPTNYSRPWDST